ncbi:M42 family metallopeptidase [Clostridiisalibacter paucivorans]|uniref:M42 family metallopeptidase n=1 Tax=Clostridiisalibacter paucivorans TaxID=408753 RepID=UPI00047892B7|nr:M42 family metallopeptidase [Clostridiisalibacter paucivorans]
MTIESGLLKNLTQIFSPSGYEDSIRDFIREEIKEYVDEIFIDKLGNLIARKKGNGKKIMVAAHMDQIGMMITNIDNNGFLRFTGIGGVFPHHVIGQKVIFENKTVGIIEMEEKIENKDKLKLKDLYIDIGAKDKSEAMKTVNIGDTCVFHSEYHEDDNRVVTKALDDRIGCYILIKTIKDLIESPNDIYFTFTVQEELGLRGAKTSAFFIEPDLGISVDITGCGDTPNAELFAVKLDGGTAIKVKDNYLITHPKVKNLMVNIAKENEIKYQMEVLEYGGTDSGAIHTSKSGVPSGVISVPTRYSHTDHETVFKSDVNASLRLLMAILQKDVSLYL